MTTFRHILSATIAVLALLPTTVTLGLVWLSHWISPNSD